MDKQQIQSFYQILEFVGELHKLYNHDSIRLYYELLNRTEVSNLNQIKKQVEVFRHFLERNKDYLSSGDVSSLKLGKIQFSNKTFINLKDILQNETDEDNKKTILSYLQVISYNIKPSNEIKEILSKKYNEGDYETNFINSFVDKVKNTFENQDISNDPFTAAMSILQSGLLTEMSQKIKNDKALDFNKLLGSVKKMSTELTNEFKSSTPDSKEKNETLKLLDGLNDPEKLASDIETKLDGQNPDLGNIMGVVSSMFGQGENNELGNMMGMVTSMMGGLNMGGSSDDDDLLKLLDKK